MEGLFTEQNRGAMSKVSLLSQEAKRTQLREMSESVSCVFAQLSGRVFSCLHTFSNLDECSLYGSKNEAWQVVHTREHEERKCDPELWQGLHLNRPTALCSLPSGLFFLAKVGRAASAPLAHPAVPDTLFMEERLRYTFIYC